MKFGNEQDILRLKKAEQELTELKAKYEELVEYKRVHESESDAHFTCVMDNAKLIQELADLKKAVASDGLGVEEMSEIIYQLDDKWDKPIFFNNEAFKIATAIVEAQTKYKKELKGEI